MNALDLVTRIFPFLTAVRKEKVYTADRGTVTVQETVHETCPLPVVRSEGRTLLFRSEDGAHQVRADVTQAPDSLTLTFTGEPGWAYEFRLPADGKAGNAAVFGGGEQYRKVNLAGETVVNFVSEHIKAKTLIEKAFTPKKKYVPKEHKDIGSYAPMPVYVTSSGRQHQLYFFDTTADGRSTFAPEGYTFCFDACPRALTVLAADSFRSLARRFASLVPNRQYLPAWAKDGMILGIQGGTDTILKKAFAVQDAGAKVSAVWSQDWSGENRTIMGKQVWWNWEVDEKLYPKLKDAIKALRERGIRFLGYINPYLVKDSRLYNYCKEQGYLIRHADGSIYHIKSTTFDAGMLDLTNPDAVHYTKEVLIKQNMLGLGMSGWMADFGEYLPADCVLANGDPRELHNEWPVIWARLNREAIEEYGGENYRDEYFFFSRAGYVGIQTYAPILWNGDQHTDFTPDYGMPCVLPASFSLGFSGVSLVHSDIGGFFSFLKIHRGDELFIRWMEMAAFSPLMRSHESLRPWANSQPDAPGVLPYTVRLTRLHAALRPYIEDVLAEAQEGLPALRPDFWEADTFAAHRDEYSYFFGSELFIAPVMEEKAVTRKLTLPKGRWVYFWTGKILEGGREITMNAPLGQPPVFYREGCPHEELFRNIKL